MLRRCIRLAVAFGFVAWLAASPAAWGTATVTVTFSGTGTTSYPNTTFNGSFTYSTGLTSPTGSGVFDFTNYAVTTYAHGGNYTDSSTIAPTSDSYVPLHLFKINASGTSFMLDTLMTQSSPATEELVQFTLTTACNGRYLPTCSSFPASGGTFVLKQSGAIVYSGNITAVSCTQVGMYVPTPAPAYSPVPCVAVPCQPACPMVACSPRPGCFARLFARSGRRVRCW